MRSVNLTVCMSVSSITRTNGVRISRKSSGTGRTFKQNTTDFLRIFFVNLVVCCLWNSRPDTAFWSFCGTKLHSSELQRTEIDENTAYRSQKLAL